MSHIRLKRLVSPNCGRFLPAMAYVSPCYAAAPIYFDLAGLIYWAAGLIALFLVLLTTAIASKNRAVKRICSIGLIGYLVVPALIYLNWHRVRGPNESWTLFTNESIEKEVAGAPIFWKLCSESSSNKSAVIPITGFRILSKESSYLYQARGYQSPIDFYAAFEARKLSAHTLVDAIQMEIKLEKLPVIFEFQDAHGAWKRSFFDSNSEKLVTEDASESVASHEIVFEQVKTGYERKYAIYGVSISVTDLSSKAIVAMNVGFTHDLYWGAHNHYRLLPRGHRCGYPEEENFVGTWLASLVRSPASGTASPYDPYRPRPVVIDEVRHWSGKTTPNPAINDSRTAQPVIPPYLSLKVAPDR